MNRRTFVVSTAALAAAVFGGAAVLYRDARPIEGAVASDGDRLVRPHSPVIGKADAPVTLVEFFDPSCEACRAFHPIVKQMLEAHPTDLRVVLRYTPLHEGSDEAVRILETARRQDRFDAVLEAMFERQPEWAVHGAPDLAKAWEIAGAAGLDLTKAKQDATLPEVDAVLKQDTADLEAVGVEKTPTFFVNGQQPAEFGPRPLYGLVLTEIGRVTKTS